MLLYGLCHFFFLDSFHLTTFDQKPFQRVYTLVQFSPKHMHHTLPYTSPQNTYLNLCVFNLNSANPTSDVLNAGCAYKSNSFTVDQFAYFQSLYYEVVLFISPILCDREIIKPEKLCTEGHGEKVIPYSLNLQPHF